MGGVTPWKYYEVDEITGNNKPDDLVLAPSWKETF